jgi:hypothetical protein
MRTHRKQRLAINRKSIATLLLAITTGFSAGAFELKDFFTSEQLAIMDKAREIQDGYSTKVFVIRQIISADKALVSCEDEDSVLHASFSGKTDGESISSAVRDGGPESYTTVIGAKRTVKSYIAISRDEMGTLEKSKPLFAKRRLVEEECRRQAGEKNFQENSTNMKVLINDLDLFMTSAESDKTSAFYKDVQLLIQKKRQLEEVFIRQEYHGPAVTEQTIADQKTELQLLSLSLAREKSDRQKDAQAKRELLEKKAAENEKTDKALYQQWKLRANIYLVLCEKLSTELLFVAPGDQIYAENALGIQAELYSYKLMLERKLIEPHIKKVPEKASLERIEYVLAKIKAKYPGEYLSAEKTAQEAIEKAGQ